MPELGSRLGTYCPTNRSKSRYLDSNRKSSQTGQAQLGLSCKASKCTDAGTRDLGVLTTHETSPMKMTILFLVSSHGTVESEGLRARRGQLNVDVSTNKQYATGWWIAIKEGYVVHTCCYPESFA